MSDTRRDVARLSRSLRRTQIALGCVVAALALSWMMGMRQNPTDSKSAPPPPIVDLIRARTIEIYPPVGEEPWQVIRHMGTTFYDYEHKKSLEISGIAGASIRASGNLSFTLEDENGKDIVSLSGSKEHAMLHLGTSENDMSIRLMANKLFAPSATFQYLNFAYDLGLDQNGFFNPRVVPQRPITIENHKPMNPKK